MAALTQISILAELERAGVKVIPIGDDEVKVPCPFHPDPTPSCTISLSKHVFKCHSGQCGRTGDFVEWLSGYTKTPRADLLLFLNKEYGLEEVKIIDPQVIEKAFNALKLAPHLLSELYKRGVTDEDIRKYRLGERDGRITIPVRNATGAYVNIRSYLPGAPGNKKMRSSPGRGKLRLYPIEQIEYPSIVLCGGEIKSIVCARICNPYAFGAICATTGEGSWDASCTKLLRGKHVVIVMDIDEAGQKAAEKYAAILYGHAASVKIAVLPLDKDKYPKGDLNDYVASEAGDLWAVICAAPLYTPTTATGPGPDTEPVDTSFSSTVLSQNVGKRMRFKGLVSAAGERSFVVPKGVLVKCDKDQDCCVRCSVYPKQEKLHHVYSESASILGMIDVPKEHLEKAMREEFGIPPACKAVSFEYVNYYNVTDIRLNSSLEISNRDSNKTMQQAYFVSNCDKQCEGELNNSYILTGRLWAHPRNQLTALVISQSEATHDALKTYEPKELHRLRKFRPAEWTLVSLTECLDTLYADLEANVTRIYFRRDLHLFMDLVYHSPLLFKLDGKEIHGWVETLVVGDSGQGKSEVFKTLMQHYELGEKVEAKNATTAGLIGGAKQLEKTWYVEWGIIPTHDQRLVCIEEAKGISTEVISHLTDMRSSGQAEMPKIEKRKTAARTRLLWLSNPRNDKAMADYTYGVEAVRELIGAPEDIRRFDAALIVNSAEIDPRQLNELVRNPPVVSHTYTKEVCRELILWAWTRKCEEVTFEDSARDLITQAASDLTEVYSDRIPLVDRGTMRNKLAKLSAALAVRTFSTGTTELELLVRECHVQYITALLKRVYSSKVFGYDYFSKAQQTFAELKNTNEIKTEFEAAQYGKEFRVFLMSNEQFDAIDIQDILAIDRDTANSVLALFRRSQAVRRDKNGKYVKTPAFIEFLKVLVIPDRPTHLKKEKF